MPLFNLSFKNEQTGFTYGTRCYVDTLFLVGCVKDLQFVHLICYLYNNFQKNSLSCYIFFLKWQTKQPARNAFTLFCRFGVHGYLLWKTQQIVSLRSLLTIYNKPIKLNKSPWRVFTGLFRKHFLQHIAH